MCLCWVQDAAVYIAAFVEGARFTDWGNWFKGFCHCIRAKSHSDSLMKCWNQVLCFELASGGMDCLRRMGLMRGRHADPLTYDSEFIVAQFVKYEMNQSTIKTWYWTSILGHQPNCAIVCCAMEEATLQGLLVRWWKLVWIVDLWVWRLLRCQTTAQ